MSKPIRDHQAFLALENMLNAAHPRTDMHETTVRLEERFRTAYSLFRADAFLLERNGLDARDALLVSKIQELNRYMAGDEAEKAKIATLTEASAYLVAAMRTLPVEQFHMLCLDARGMLIKRLILEEGTEDAALFSLRDVIAHVIRYAPKYVVMAHNHPRHTLHPSEEDLDCTRKVIRILSSLGIPLLDHVIVAGRNAVSIRDNAFLPADVWISQAPEDKLLRGWLSDVVSE